MQPSCGARESGLLADQLEQEIAAKNLPINVIRQRCLGMCEHGPNLKLAPGGKFYNQVGYSDLVSLIDDITSFCEEK